MAKLGRRQKPGLRWHGGNGQWFRLYNGKPRYFGPVGKKAAEADESVKPQAEQEWHEHEISRLSTEVTQPSVAPLAQNIGRMFDALERVGAAELLIQHAQTDEEIADIRERLSHGLADIAPQAGSPSPNDNGKTCQDIVDAYMEYLKNEADRERSKKSHYLDARARLKKWIQEFGNLPIRALTRDHFVRYRDKMNRAVANGEVSQSHANKMFRLVKAAFNTARREKGSEKGYSTAMIPEFLTILKTRKTDPTDRPIFEPEHIKKLLNKCDADQDLKFKAIIILTLNCGLSNTDIAFLTWDQIVWGNKYLNLTRTKNKGIRRTPLWDRTIQALKKWKAECPAVSDDDLVFPNENGVPFIAYTDEGQQSPHGKKYKGSKNDNLSRAFHRLAEGLGVPSTFSTFRKSAASIGLDGTDHTGIVMLLGDAGEAIWKKHYAMVNGQNAKVKGATDAIHAHYFSEKKQGRGKREAQKKAPNQGLDHTQTDKTDACP